MAETSKAVEKTDTRERGSFGSSGRWQPDIKNGETAFIQIQGTYLRVSAFFFYPNLILL